jgi:hypothetical protein
MCHGYERTNRRQDAEERRWLSEMWARGEREPEPAEAPVTEPPEPEPEPEPRPEVVAGAT